MDRKWTRLIEQAGDASIGSGLVRLARQAASVHLAEQARQIAADANADAPSPAGHAGRLGGTDARLHHAHQTPPTAPHQPHKAPRSEEVRP